MDKKKKQVAIACVSLAALVAIFGVAYALFAPKTTAGAKNIVVSVVHRDKSVKDVKIQSNAAYLRGALEEQKLIEGNESEYGLFITTVDGEMADEGKQEWWCITKGGGQVNESIDKLPIADGEKYELTLTVGY